MPKAVFFELSGVVVQDQALRRLSMEAVLHDIGLVLGPEAYREVCLGRTDTLALRMVLEMRGRTVTKALVQELVDQRGALYLSRIDQQCTLVAGVQTCINQLAQQGIPLGLVTHAPHREVIPVLLKMGVKDNFAVVVCGDEVAQSKPHPESYQTALIQLNQLLGQSIEAPDCVALESTYPGVLSAQACGMQAVGLPTVLPYQMLHRRADWVVNHFDQIEWERIAQVVT
ncbi:MAG: HAD family phosphatase [Gloeobacterales cyanobacterium]